MPGRASPVSRVGTERAGGRPGREGTTAPRFQALDAVAGEQRVPGAGHAPLLADRPRRPCCFISLPVAVPDSTRPVDRPSGDGGMRPGEERRGRSSARLDVTASNPAAPGSRLATFKRLYRWFNLTLVQQGLWPLLILLAGAPLVRPGVAPWPWLLAAIAAPALAAGLAGLAVAQQPGLLAPAADAAVGPARPEPVRQQVRLLLFGLAGVLAVARVLLAPEIATVGFLLFGIVDVLAFQLIHFGVVARSFTAPDQGQAAAVGLFGIAWGLRELFLAGVGVGNADLGLSFGGGLVIGLAVGLLSRGLRRWPGGFWPAAAGHWLLIYLIAGFIT